MNISTPICFQASLQPHWLLGNGISYIKQYSLNPALYEALLKSLLGFFFLVASQITSRILSFANNFVLLFQVKPPWVSFLGLPWQIPTVWQLNTPDVHCLTMLEARSLQRKVGRGAVPVKAPSASLFQASLLEPGDSLARGRPPAVASSFPSPSSPGLAVFLPPSPVSHEETSAVGFRAHPKSKMISSRDL